MDLRNVTTVTQAQEMDVLQIVNLKKDTYALQLVHLASEYALMGLKKALIVKSVTTLIKNQVMAAQKIV
jgi:hypothetical protein